MLERNFFLQVEISHGKIKVFLFVITTQSQKRTPKLTSVSRARIIGNVKNFFLCYIFTKSNYANCCMFLRTCIC